MFPFGKKKTKHTPHVPSTSSAIVAQRPSQALAQLSQDIRHGFMNQTGDSLEDKAMGNDTIVPLRTPAYPWSFHRISLLPPVTKGGRVSMTPSPSPFPRYGHSLPTTANANGDLFLFGGLVAESAQNDLYLYSTKQDTATMIQCGGEIPSPRVGHASALIGNVLFVWGGDTNNVAASPGAVGEPNDNGLYLLNLISREWTRIVARDQAPSGRYGHTVTLIGSTIYVFGGQVDETFQNDLWAFDLNTLRSKATWEKIEQTGKERPAPRTGHTCVPYQSQLVIFGGTNAENYYQDVWSFDLDTRRWTEVQSIGFIPAPREGHAAAIVSDVIYVFGGRGVDGKDLGDLVAFNIPQKRWFIFQTMGPAPSARSGHAMASIGTKVFVVGGESFRPSAAEDPDTVHVLDTKHIKYPPPIVRPRSEEATERSRSPDTPRQRTEDLPREILPASRSPPPYNELVSSYSQKPGSSEGSANGTKTYDTDLLLEKEKEWGKERDKLLAREKMLQDELSKQDQERREETARNVDLQNQLQMEREKQTILENELEKLKVIARETEGKQRSLESELEMLRVAARETKEVREKERSYEVQRQEQAQVEKERLMGLVYRTLLFYLVRRSLMENLPKSLQSNDAQMLVDYLSDMLSHSDILQSKERKRALHLLCKIAKSAQVFPKAIELSGVECDFGKSIIEGGFGVIYKGKFQEETVCVKAVRMYQFGAKKRALRAHAGELVLGTHVLHPNILPFYGAYISGEATPRICIASLWVEGGNLVDHLDKYPDAPRVALVSDVLSGLRYLHEMAIIHADLKGANVLVSPAHRALLADFGVSRIAMTSVGTTTGADSGGTTYWMAPELLTTDEPIFASRESDMWAFGCVCYEMLAGKIPFEGYKPLQLIRAFTTGSAILSRPSSNPSISYADEIWSLAEKCLDYDPNKRIAADEALNIVLNLNVKDERPPPATNPNVFSKRRRSDIVIDYDAIISIIQHVEQSQ